MRSTPRAVGAWVLRILLLILFVVLANAAWRLRFE